MTVRELLVRIDSAELTEWVAYFKLQQEPAKPPGDAPNVLRGKLAHLVKRKDS